MFNSSIRKSVRDSVLANKLPRKELARLDEVGTVLTLDETTEIIARGSLGRECFVIVDGEFHVVGDGFESNVTGGAVVGELALLTGNKRNASVVASSEAQVYALHPREFATLLSDSPQFCKQVLTEACHRLGTNDVTMPAQFVRRAS